MEGVRVEIDRIYVAKTVQELNSVYLLSLQYLQTKVSHPSIELAAPTDYIRHIGESQVRDLVGFAIAQKHVVMQPRLGPIFNSVLELGEQGLDVARLALTCTLHRPFRG
jgi:hypothetical protein